VGEVEQDRISTVHPLVVGAPLQQDGSMPESESLWWDTSHETLEILRRRRTEKSTPGARTAGDHAKVGLVAPGGGMRGVVSGAMMSALEDLGYKDAFDVVYGFSAGAVNAAYFIAGDTWYALSIYYDHLASDRFLDFTRPFRGMPIMSLDYVFEVVAAELNPLDYEAVRNSALSLVIAITMVDTKEPELIRSFESNEDLKQALIASCWLPFTTFGTTRFRGRPAVDGGVLMPSLLTAAEDDGCTHVMCLRTQPVGRPPGHNGMFRQLSSRYLDRLSPGLGAAYLEAWGALSSEEERQREARVLQVGPLPSHPELVWNDINPTKVFRAARYAYGSMYALLEQIPIQDVLDGLVEVVPRLSVRRKKRPRDPSTELRTESGPIS
jgi:predicted patatin/cPLA2 family phospholipase